MSREGREEKIDNKEPYEAAKKHKADLLLKVIEQLIFLFSEQGGKLCFDMRE